MPGDKGKEKESEAKPVQALFVLNASFKLEFEIDDTKVELWQEEQKVVDKTTAWVASRSGSEFAVWISDVRPQSLRQATRVAMYLDGKIVLEWIVNPDSTGVRARFEGLPQSDSHMKAFTFDKVNLTDEIQEASKDMSFLKGLGRIRFTFHRINYFGKIVTTHNGDYSRQTIHEQQKKATLSHQSTVGKLKQRRVSGPSMSHSFTYIDPKDSPQAEFEVKYRSKELLEIQGIIPMANLPLVPTTTTQNNSNKRKIKPEVLVISSDEDEEEDAHAAKLKRVKLEKNKKPKRELGLLTID